VLLTPKEELDVNPSSSSGLLESEIVEKYGLEDFQKLDLLDEKGKIRLAPAQRYFNENENYFPLLPKLFETWRDEAEYMVFKHEHEGKTMYLASKCSKRGNDVYVRRVKNRFKLFNQKIPDTKFFSVEDFKPDREVKTKLLWVTLTWNTRNSPSIRRAWWGSRRASEYKMNDRGRMHRSYIHVSEGCQCVSCKWNRWISAVRSRYGKVSVLRSWETSQRGYPHIHAVLSFESSEFKVFPHFNEREGRMSFRVQEKHEFESLWDSFTDIEAISSTKKLAHYVMKYQLKVNEGREGTGDPESPTSSGSRTLSFMWLFRKRSYSMSGAFTKIFARLDRDLHNSNMVSDEKWELVGIFSGRDLGLNGEWFAEISSERLRGLVEDGDSRVDEGINNYD